MRRYLLLTAILVASANQGARPQAVPLQDLTRDEIRTSRPFGTLREQFAYRITDAAGFDPATPASFDFADRRPDREQALFIQDQVRLGALSVNAGLRWDHYRLVVRERAWSPRIGAAWSWPHADLVIRGSYDRAFQTPAFENLLLASSPAVEALDASVVRLPVRPSRGDFFEAE